MAGSIRALFSESKTPYLLYVLALVAHLVFFYALLYLYGPCSFFLSNDCTLSGNDTQHYVIIANNIADGNGYSRFLEAPYEPDGLRTPFLPIYFVPFALAGGYSLIWLAILLLNLVLALAAPLIYKLARFFVPHGFALAAGIVMSLEPLYLYRSQIAEPDALLVLFVAGAMYFLVLSWKENQLKYLALCAALLGLAVLAKPNAQYLAVFVLIFETFFLLFFSPRSRSDRWRFLAVFVGVIFAIVAPWLVRNYAVFGVPQLSSIQGYNLYQYYTSDFALPNEQVPNDIQKGSREPSRYLPYQTYFTGLALERIKAAPGAYLQTHLIGALRNLFVSDISAIYYYGHTKLLPFPYSPESQTNIHKLLAAGDFAGLVKSAPTTFPKLAWSFIMLIFYIAAFAGLFFAWRRERVTFLAFLLFFALYGYLLISSGPYVEAKYRLPGLGLVFIAATFGAQNLFQWLRTVLPFRAN